MIRCEVDERKFLYDLNNMRRNLLVTLSVAKGLCYG
jgi:hypothetical protein